MSNFDVAFYRVIGNEGKFQNDPKDRGNWTSGVVGRGKLEGTKFGISAMTYPDLDIESLTMEDAKAIYKRDWWDKMKMDRFPDAITFQMFDAAIHHGMYNATRILQRAIDTRADGVIGPKTLGALDQMDINDLLMRFLAYRLLFMASLKNFKDYGRGFSRRIAHNLILASEDN